MVQKETSIKSMCLPSNFDKKSHSEPEPESSRHWTVHTEGFPPGVTVDELRQYRKKCPPHFNRPADNLHVEEGSLKSIKTEYVRSFHPHQGVNLVVDGKIQEGQNQIRAKHSFSHRRPRRPYLNLKINTDDPMEFITENSNQFVAFQDVPRVKSLRRSTALKPEGELFTETESQHEFHFHNKAERVHPIKRATNLKLDGLFENLTSEHKEKYVAFLILQRPKLLKKETQLRMEGDLDMSTECRLQYIPPSIQEKPLLRKRSTSLKLEGEAEYWPEYRRSYVEYPTSRPFISRPRSHLRSEGELSHITESQSQFTIHPINRAPISGKLSNNIFLEGDFDANPEYHEQFIKYGRSKSDLIKRTDNLKLEGNLCFETEKDKYRTENKTCHVNKNLHAAGLPTQYSHSHTRANSPTNASPLSVAPEYRSRYIDFPRKRPTVVKPSSSLISSGDFEAVSEQKSQYHSYGKIVKTTPRRRPESLTLEGKVECFPEYKRSFVEHPVTLQRSFKAIQPVTKEYPSFQVLELSQGEIRNGRKEKKSSDTIVQENISSITPEANSPDLASQTNLARPTYRLEVENTDIKPVPGFHRGPGRIFPSEAVVSKPWTASDKHQEAFQAALRRKDSFERKCSAGSQRNTPTPTSKPQSVQLVDDRNKKSFVVLEHLNQNSNEFGDVPVQ